MFDCGQTGKRQQTRKEDVSVQGLCSVQVYNLSHVKSERTNTPAQLQTLVKSCQLSSSVVPVRTTISHIQISRKVLRYVIQTSVAHLANINRQPDHLCVRMFSKSVLLVSVTGHSSSQCE